MSFIINFFIGLVIGIGFIIPGVSGGALAVILDVYDKIFNSIKNIKNKNNFLFLLTISIGVLVGIIGFGNIILFLIETREVPTKYIFIGLLLGSIPSLIKNIKRTNNDKFKLLPLFLAIFISVILYFLENSNIGLNISDSLNSSVLPIIPLFIAGILYAAGKIIPGISGSALLILVGMYEYLLKIIANPLLINGRIFISLIPFMVGVVFGIFVLYKLMDYLFLNHYMLTYSAILGFVLGSLLYLYPGFSFDFSGLICIVLLISSYYFSYILTK